MGACRAGLASAILGGFGGQVISSQAPILLATLIAIVATAGQVAYLLARGRKVDKMLWISLAIQRAAARAYLAASTRYNSSNSSASARF